MFIRYSPPFTLSTHTDLHSKNLHTTSIDILQLLPEATVPTRVCVDKTVGSVRMGVHEFLNASLTQGRTFDLVMIEPLSPRLTPALGTPHTYIHNSA